MPILYNLVLVLGEIRSHNVLIFGQTPWSSCVLKRLIWMVRWIVFIAEAVRMTDAQANLFPIFIYQ